MLGTKLLLLSVVAYVSGQSVTYYGGSNVRGQSRLPPRFPGSYRPTAPNVEPISPVYNPQPVYQPPAQPDQPASEPIYHPPQEIQPQPPSPVRRPPQLTNWPSIPNPPIYDPKPEPVAPEISSQPLPRPVNYYPRPLPAWSWRQQTPAPKVNETTPRENFQVVYPDLSSTPPSYVSKAVDIESPIDDESGVPSPLIPEGSDKEVEPQPGTLPEPLPAELPDHQPLPAPQPPAPKPDYQPLNPPVPEPLPLYPEPTPRPSQPLPIPQPPIPRPDYQPLQPPPAPTPLPEPSLPQPMPIPQPPAPRPDYQPLQPPPAPIPLPEPSPPQPPAPRPDYQPMQPPPAPIPLPEPSPPQPPAPRPDYQPMQPPPAPIPLPEPSPPQPMPIPQPPAPRPDYQPLQPPPAPIPLPEPSPPQPKPIPQPPAPRPDYQPLQPPPAPIPLPEPSPPQPKPIPQPPAPRPDYQPLQPPPTPIPLPEPSPPQPKPIPQPPAPRPDYQPLQPPVPESILVPSIPQPQPIPSYPIPAPEVPIIPLADFQCNKGNAYYTILNECDAYIKCQNQRAWKHTCPDGLNFNPNALYPAYPCAYPSEVKCESTSSKQTAHPTSECPNQYGFFSMSGGDCSKYIMCQEGKATIMKCPFGLVFNDRLSSCDWPENVPQCNLNAFKDFTCPIPPEDDPDRLTRYRYGNDCSMYVACQRGHPRLLKCDLGLSFDEDSQVCIDADLVMDCRSRETKYY